MGTGDLVECGHIGSVAPIPRMITPSPTHQVLEKSPLAERFARIAFLLQTFFIFFGTSMPFREKTTRVDDIATSDLTNQIVFTALLLLCSVSIRDQWNRMWMLLTREKLLTLFLAWCVLSIFWSPYPFTSFKLLFKMIITFMVCIALLLHSNSSDTAWTYLTPVVYLYILVNAAAILFFPGAVDPDFGAGTWRGIAPTKNQLGETMVMSMVVLAYSIRDRTPVSKIVSLLMLLASAGLLFLSRSMTSTLASIALVALGLTFSIRSTLNRKGGGTLFSFLLLFSLIGMYLATYFLAPEMITSGFAFLGKDPSLTGRTELWQDIFEETQKHLLFGTGFGGFWIVDSQPLMNLYHYYVWFPRHSHNGYLDLLNETGIVGLFLLAAMVLSYFINLVRFGRLHFSFWFVVGTLVINLQESTLFRGGFTASGVLFVFAYLALYLDLISLEARSGSTASSLEEHGKSSQLTSR